MEWKVILILSIVLLVYSALGALMFLAVEGPHSLLQQGQFQRDIDDIKSRYAHLPTADVDQIIEDVLKLTSLPTLVQNGTQSVSQWNYARSFFFVGTLISTIGYGNLTPVTTLGRMLCIIYAFPAIPVNFVLLAGVGSKINTFSKNLDTCLRGVAKCPKNKCLMRALTTLIVGWAVFIFLPSLYWSYVEGWTYVDAVYFSFTTLATVGFGDLSPDLSVIGPGLESWRLLIVAWVWTGLAWLSCVIATAQDYLQICAQNVSSPKRKHTLSTVGIEKKYKTQEKSWSSEKPEITDRGFVSHTHTEFTPHI